MSRTMAQRKLAFLVALAVGCAARSPSPAPEAIGTTIQAESDTFGLGTGAAGAATITALGTVVNTYASVTAVDATGTQITVGTLQGAPGPLSPDDLLMVWRTTGLGSATSGLQTAVPLAGDVGAYEFARVKAATASVVTVTNPLTSTTRFATGSQVVRVPEYTTLTVASGASIVPYPWDGTCGGAVVLFATGALTSAGAVVADGAGFRGAGLENAPGIVGCTLKDGSDIAAASPNCGGAHKGEGLYASAYATPATPYGSDAPGTYGYGNYANGAGGGDAANAGGGGGGGYAGTGMNPGQAGQGGVGGNTWLSDGDRPFGGLGGAALTYDPTQSYLAFGGGGGAGDENNSVGTAGGAGGGVVLVRAGSIAGTGSFSASGATVTALSGNDGAGGGGGAGAVVLFSAADADCTLAAATGGTGGTGATDPDGPGGGGGGGLVLIEASRGSCPVSVFGGNHGTTTTSNVTYENTAYGAVNGFSGAGMAANGASFGGSVCAPTDIAANHCGGCVSDADCPAGDLCDTAKNSCGACSTTSTTACTGDTPVCDTTGAIDACVTCDGDFGATAVDACPSATDPVCVTNGPNKGACGLCNTAGDCTTAAAPACSIDTNTCTTCNGDNAATATAACGTTEPYCQAAGTCGKCATASDCVGNHAGPICDVATGACGTACTTDSECNASDWCDNLTSASGVCQPKIANGKPVPGGQCKTSVASRACVSGVCDSDNDCGYLNGDGPCGESDAGASVCRSGQCPATGPNANKCEACATSAVCSSTQPVCSPTSNACVECTADDANACVGNRPACNTTTNVCAACDGDNGTASSLECPTSAAPFCDLMLGTCGLCVASSQCAAGHPGPICDTATGACGTSCNESSECPAADWCNAAMGASGACVAKLADGTSLPSSPPGLSVCTNAVGAEVCSSGTCNKTNRCGVLPDAGVDASVGADASSSPVSGTTIEGGSVACDVHGGVGTRGGQGGWFGLALAATALARRRRR